MKESVIVLLMMSCISGITRCQTMIPGAESESLGGISVLMENTWSAAGNPAGLAKRKHFSAATSFEQRYLLKEMGNYALAASIPAFGGALAACVTFQGFELFRKYAFNLSYGMNIGNVLSAGAGLFYILTRSANANLAVHQVSYSLGMQSHLSDKLMIGFMAFNPFNMYYQSASYARLPVIFRLGLKYMPAESFAILTEIEKDLDYDPVFRIGCAYELPGKISLWGGLSLFPANYRLGAGFYLRKLKVEVSAGYHQYLGASPCTSLLYPVK